MNQLDAGADRRRRVSGGRAILALALGIQLIVVLGLLGSRSSTAGEPLGQTAVALAVSAGIWLLCILGLLYVLAAGSSCDRAFLYSYRIPLRALWDDGEVGKIGASDVREATLRERAGIAVLVVASRDGLMAGFNAFADPNGLEEALSWLKSRGLEIRVDRTEVR